MSNQEIIEVSHLPKETKNENIYYINQNNPNQYTHSYYKYPCKFIPEIPRWAIEKYLSIGNSNILDPFAGSGTVMLEGLLQGHNTYGTEIDMVAKIIIESKVQILNINDISNIEKEKRIIDQKRTGDEIKPYLPKINNLEHWFKIDHIKKLGILRSCIDNINGDKEKKFFEVCFLSIIKKCSNADDMSPKPYVSSRIKKEPPCPYEEFDRIYRSYLSLEQKMASLNINNESRLLNGDALSIDSNKKIDLAITSPPYINAFDYARIMRLENLWMGLMTETEILHSKNYYVGTERISIEEELECLGILSKSSMLSDNYNEILKHDKKRALIVKKFFEDIEINLKEVYRLLKKGGHYVIVVGDSKIRGIDVYTSKIIREIASEVGYHYIESFSYVIRNPYIRIPRSGRGGKIDVDNILVLKK